MTGQKNPLAYYGIAAAMGAVWFGLMLVPGYGRGILLHGMWLPIPPWYWLLSLILTSLIVAWGFRKFFADPGDLLRQVIFANGIAFVAIFAMGWLAAGYGIATGHIPGEDGPPFFSREGLQLLLTVAFYTPALLFMQILGNLLLVFIPLGWCHVLLMRFAATLR